MKLAAAAVGVPVLQPERLRDPEWPERLHAIGADVAVVVAFGQILPKPVLEAPARGSINVHASLLPKYRGAAPIQWALIRGETTTGVTTFRMDPGMDTGDVLLSASTAIAPNETAGELADRLARLGADVLIDTLRRLDTITPTPQRHDEATMAPRLTKYHGAIDWRRSARDVVNLVRGCNPWPGAFVITRAGTLTLWRARAVDGRGEPGTIVAHDDTLAIAAHDGLVLPVEVQPQSRRALAWPDYLRGARLAVGASIAA